MASTGKNQLAVVSGYQERSLLPDRPKARWKCAKAAVLLIFQRCVGDRFLGCQQFGFLFCEAEVPATPVEGSEPIPALPQPWGRLVGIPSKIAPTDHGRNAVEKSRKGHNVTIETNRSHSLITKKCYLITMAGRMLSVLLF